MVLVAVADDDDEVLSSVYFQSHRTEHPAAGMFRFCSRMTRNRRTVVIPVPPP